MSLDCATSNFEFRKQISHLPSSGKVKIRYLFAKSAIDLRSHHEFFAHIAYCAKEKKKQNTYCTTQYFKRNENILLEQTARFHILIYRDAKRIHIHASDEFEYGGVTRACEDHHIPSYNFTGKNWIARMEETSSLTHIEAAACLAHSAGTYGFFAGKETILKRSSTGGTRKKPSHGLWTVILRNAWLRSVTWRGLNKSQVRTRALHRFA